MFVRRVGAVATAVVIAVSNVGGAEAAMCVRGVAKGDTLRMRSGPAPESREVGRIPPGACGVAIVGGCRGWWCPVTWRGRTGWSHSSYLAQPGPLAALGIPVWGRPVGKPHEARGSVPPRTVRSARQLPPVETASVARPTQSVARTISETEQTPPSGAAPAAPPPKPVPAAAPMIVPTPQAAPSAPPPVHAAIVPPAAAAVPATPPPVQGPATPAARNEMCVVDIPKEDTLKVRAGPGLDQALRFGFPSGACGVKLTGACNDGWCPVDYRGYRGWAEQKFLK